MDLLMQFNYLLLLFLILMVLFAFMAVQFHGRLKISLRRAFAILAVAFAATLANSLTNLLGNQIAMAASVLALGVIATILSLAFFEKQKK